MFIHTTTRTMKPSYYITMSAATPPTTLRQAVSNAQTACGQPASKPAPRLPLATPVLLRNGVSAVVCGTSTCDANRYELAWFDRHYWQVRRKFYDRECFEVMTTSAAAFAEGV